MIWTLINIKRTSGIDRIKTHTVSPPQHFTSAHTKIALIGGGPKGIYALERLVAEINAADHQEPVEIHIYNDNEHFASGNNYRIDQPEYLLINYSIGNINMWIDELPTSSVPDNMSLLEWVNKFKSDSTIAEETHYASRALVGKYLQYGLTEILSHLPSHVMVKLVIGHVSDIKKVDQKYKLTLDDGLIGNAYDRLLLATGHSDKFVSPKEEEYRNFVVKHKSSFFIPTVYPTQDMVSKLPKKLDIAIKGMGLTFVDATLALTEGNGGSFYKKEDELIYKVSGREPSHIYAFSRGGLPMLPRGPLKQSSRYQTQYFTEDYIRKIKTKYPKGSIDFEKELLPVIRKEYRFAYYSTWMKNLNYDFNDHPDLFEDEIKLFRKSHRQVPSFHMEAFLNPLSDKKFNNPQEYHRYIIRYLENGIAEAKIGELKSPQMTAVAVWREITPLISPLYEFGGFTAESQKIFEKEYFGKFSRVTFGPPIENMEKILALAKASILQFTLGPSPEVYSNEASGKFRIESKYPHSAIDTDCLIDARIAKPTLNEGSSEIYCNLIKRNIAAPFFNGNYSPGCINISSEGYVIDSEGKVNPDIALTGTPTEGATLDNDTLSRTRNNFVSNWAKYTISLLKKQAAFTAK